MLNKKSKANLRIAKLCLNIKNKFFYSVGASRAYYAIFQATKYLLVKNCFDYKKFKLDNPRVRKQRDYAHGNIREDNFMNRKLKEMIKNHITIVKGMYPELYIEVDTHYDDILICIDSQEISNEEEYEDLMYNFTKEYESHGFYNVYWGVNSSLTCDNLMMFKNLIKAPKKEILKTQEIKKMPLAKARA